VDLVLVCVGEIFVFGILHIADEFELCVAEGQVGGFVGEVQLLEVGSVVESDFKGGVGARYTDDGAEEADLVGAVLGDGVEEGGGDLGCGCAGEEEG
jgi:hypothetical protein